MKHGWEEKTLGDVLAVLRNGVNCKQDKIGIGDKISRIESISNAVFDIDKVGYAVLTESDKEKYCLKKGDILFSHINSPVHVGKTALFNSEEEVYHGVNLLLMRTKPILNNNYLEHYLKFIFQNGYWKGLCKQSVNQASVNQQDINKVRIKYPKSLHEQQRIIAILDEAFAAIAKANANAEHNLKNAKELFESYLLGVFEKKGEGWEEKSVQEFVDEGKIYKPLDGNHGEVHPLKSDYVDAGVPFIMSRDMKDGSIDEENCKFISEKQARSLRTGFAINGDVLLSHKGTIGSVALLQTKNDFVVLTPQITYYRIKDHSKFINKFIYYQFLSPSFQKTINGIAEGGSTRAYIGITKQLTLKLIIAPLKVQQSIVQRLDALSAETKKLEAIYQAKIDYLVELKKSILEKAFNGEITVTVDAS